ncbi:MAG: peptide chain release factor 2 [Candidatus Pacebacteria bacterium]|nr:peptide chain release factor 2 [Candidatus Paceibacterota bacterium]
MEKKEIWENFEKQKDLLKRIDDLKELIQKWEEIQKEVKEIEEFLQIGEEDLSYQKEIEEKIKRLEEKIKEEEIKTFLSSPYDKLDAILEIRAGAGGRDAQDWATMLLRMYLKFCEKKGFKTKILHQSFGEPGSEGRIGTKEVSVLIKGKYAYGFLKRERGAHRLVRTSPFSAQKLRHTSFVSVDVIPVLPKKETKIEIRPDDLKIETFRASGPGGQYVNRRETAVRITHIPTGIVVSCQGERSQAQNRELAEKMLLAKLAKKKEEEEKERLKKIKGEKVVPAWGNQIRSYVFHPYKLVKDHRTGVEVREVEEVLDGELDKFIEAEIKSFNT